MPRSPSLVAVVLALAACPGDEGAGMTTGSSAAGSTSTASASSSATVDPTGAVCPPLDDAAPGGGPFVEVTFENRRDVDVFVADPTFCIGGYLAIGGGGGTSPERACATCGASVADDCGCAKVCLSLPPLRLTPGARYTDGWDGRIFVPLAIPAGCAPDCTASCQVAELAPAGTYMLTTSALTPEECEAAGCGTCTPGPDGWCATGDAIEAMGTPIVRMFDYPDETALSVVFE